jgi:hypothetical protein
MDWKKSFLLWKKELRSPDIFLASGGKNFAVT